MNNKTVSIGASAGFVGLLAYVLYNKASSHKKSQQENIKKEKSSTDTSTSPSKESKSKISLYFSTLNEQSRSIWHYCLLNEIDIAVDFLDDNKERLHNENQLDSEIVMKDGDFILNEGPAIVRYLAEREKKNEEWFGDSLEMRSLVDQYMSWHQRHLALSHDVWKYTIEENLKGTLDFRSPSKLAHKLLQESLNTIENVFLRSGSYLCGDRMTYADLLAAHQIWQHTEFQGFYQVNLGERTKSWLQKMERSLFTEQVLGELREMVESEAVVNLRKQVVLCDKYAFNSLGELDIFKKGILHDKPLLRPVVVSGPSGVGKSTLITALRKKFPESFSFAISHTTRKPRPSEEHGVNYYFVSKEEFLQLKDKHTFIEDAEYSGNCYGTSYDTLDHAKSQGRICLLDIDLQGIKTIKSVWNKERGPMPAFVQLVPPNFNELKKRLVGRGDTAEEAVIKRLEQARTELSHTLIPDFFDYVVINENIEEAVHKLALAINESQKQN